MKLKAFALSVLIFAVGFSSLSLATPKEHWTSVKSTNFFLIGNAGEKEIRSVAEKLEVFREVFSRVLSSVKVNSGVPTIVIVFDSDHSYSPFRPKKNADGYFLNGSDRNYVTMNSSVGGNYVFRVIFHEMTHQMVANSMGTKVPLWFNEGLAEYYSTMELDKDQVASLGVYIPEHVSRLRSEPMIPLETLLSVDERSPYYNEADKEGMFYAESWEFVHYLILGDRGKHKSELNTFLTLESNGVPVRTAFPQAFHTDFKTMLETLKNYIHSSSVPDERITFKQKLALDTPIVTTEISDAQKDAYLGDLLTHLRNFDEAEKYLIRSLASEPDAHEANTSLGILRFKQGKFDEARELLKKAVASDSTDFRAHYYYADAINLSHGHEGASRGEFSAEETLTMREELTKAIAIRPTFVLSYALLGYVNLVAGEQIDESIAMLRQQLASAPNDSELNYILAQLLMHKHEYKAAIAILDYFAKNGKTEHVRDRAKSMLDRAQHELAATEGK